jgi:serine/threonine-protein kinase
MAYVSNESGRMDVYVRPYPVPGGERHVVSSEGGMQPRWSQDGRELYYRGYGSRPKLMAVPVETRGRFRAGNAQALFDDAYAGHASSNARAQYDVTPDGRFVFVEAPPVESAPNRLVLIPNWSRELEAKLRAAR